MRAIVLGAMGALGLALGLEAAVSGAGGQNVRHGLEIPAQEVLRPITVSFFDTPIRDVLFAFADFAGRSVVPGADVEGRVSAEIRNQAWDTAFRAILEAHGLVAREMESGIIRVENARSLFDQETVLPLSTRPFRLSYAEAEELRDPVAALLTERGRVSVGQGTNTLVVTDISRVLDAAGELVQALDIRVPQIDIAAEIIFVNRTGMEGLGITYELKDRRGNQLNFLTPGAVDRDGDGSILLPDEQVDQGTGVVSLGGNSLAALGNATNRIGNPTLTILASLVVGRSTLIAFIDALESVQLTDVEAHPSLRVMDNRTARISVGEETPVRVIDAGSQVLAGDGGGGRSSVPVATVDYKETGVILEVTPRVATGDDILLELTAERSSADLAPSEVGLIFRRQRAESRVLVKDGETVVIGGLTVTETGEVRSGIPLLMDLPLIGRFFRSQRASSIERELLILVTPRIVRSGSPASGTN